MPGEAGEPSEPVAGPALDGVTVLDRSDSLAGAYCTKLLADAGADVVVVEPPGGSVLRRRQAGQGPLGGYGTAGQQAGGRGVAGGQAGGRGTGGGPSATRGGDPTAGEADLGRPPAGGDGAGSVSGALFGFLHTSKRSVVVDSSDARDAAALEDLLGRADIVVEEGRPGTLVNGAHPLRLRHAGLIVVSLSPFGLAGPWAERAATEFTLQALSGSIGGRGEPDGSPVAAGGELTEWAAGVTAAVGALVALRRRQQGGDGDLVDVSRLEASVMIFNGFQAVAGQVAPTRPGPFRVVEVPSIEPAKDGWVGFCTLSAAQFSSFADMIGAPEWASDPEIERIDYRASHPRPLRARIAEWTTRHTVADIGEESARRRIPFVPVGNGETVLRVPHLVERGVFVPHPGAEFLQPRVPYRLSRTPQGSLRPAPALGNTTPADLTRTGGWGNRADVASGAEAAGPPAGRSSAGRTCAGPSSAGWSSAGRSSSTPSPAGLPLSGVRVFDFTSFWAGPIVGQLLGFFGAEVIKVESVQRPDGTRLGTSYGVAGDRPWERAPLFHAVNTGKRGVTLDLTRPEGRAIARRLLGACDILIENYSARVAEQFGLVDRDQRPDLIVVRMPAFGLTGSWRDLPGFAQTMEQVSGLAWVTGFPDGPPLIPRGPCDPIGGLHAALATLVALRERDRSGLGQTVEAPLVESALNVAAEQVLEWTAAGHLLERGGNHSGSVAPQNVYRCLGDDSWVALAVATDAQWQALRSGLGHPSWAAAPELDTVPGRLAAEERIDAGLTDWCRERPADVVVETLWPLGVPVARVVHPRRVIDNPQLWVRRFFEPVEHPAVGTVALPGFPARLSSRPMPLHRSPAPTLGQHNGSVLGGLLGIGDDELRHLAEAGIIGDRPRA